MTDESRRATFVDVGILPDPCSKDLLHKSRRKRVLGREMDCGAADLVGLGDLVLHRVSQLRACHKERQMLWLRYESHQVAAQREHHGCAVRHTLFHVRNRVLDEGSECLKRFALGPGQRREIGVDRRWIVLGFSCHEGTQIGFSPAIRRASARRMRLAVAVREDRAVELRGFLGFLVKLPAVTRAR
jgi:hypothetical protein